MKERDNKTIMCSVLFLDIVEYSRKPVSEQIALKDGFNALLASAIHDVPVNDRIILDTGDGAAISFLGDVEDALKAAMRLRDSLLVEGEHMAVLRMGINLGPVQLVMDINGQPNIVGDGINVAQRVMGFADPGQILVSRSYFDAVSRLSHDYADLFHYQGSRTDKHVREHEIYAIGYPGDLAKLRQGTATGKSGGFGAVQIRGAAGWFAALRDASDQRRMLYAGLFAAMLVLLVALLVKITRSPVAPVPPLAVAPAPVEQQEAQSASAVASVLQGKPETAKGGPQGNTPEVKEKKHKHKHVRVVIDKTGKEIPISRIRTLEETTAPAPSPPPPERTVAPGPPALVSIAITPWGEVYLDGKIQGVSPPLIELQVSPGKHQIEIRNTTFPVYQQDIEVKAGGSVTIKHKF